MSRTRQMTLAVLAALAATFAYLYWSEAQKGAEIAGPGGVSRPGAAGHRDAVRGGASAKDGRSGANPSGQSGVSRDGSAAATDPQAAPGGVKDMPTTAADFLALIRDLVDRDPEGHGEEDVLQHVMEDFYNLLVRDPEQRRAALDLFKTELQPNVLELMTLVLGRIEMPEVKETMKQIAQFDTMIERREQALAALGFFESVDVVPVALGVLRSETDPRLQAKAVEALPDIPPDGTSPEQRTEVAGQLARLVQSTDTNVRINAFRALGDWSDESYTPTLLDGLRDREMTVRATAAYSLALRAEHSPSSKEALLHLLQDTSEHIEVRGTAADALRNWSTNDPEIRSAVSAFQEWERQNPPQPPSEDPPPK